MTRFLLDTTVLIDLSKDTGTVQSTLQSLVDAGGTLGVCAICVAEFMSGIPGRHRRQWERWLADLEYLDMPREAATLAGEIRHDLARQGRALHVADALMAATAMVNGAILLTNNVKEYQILGLEVMRVRP